MKREIEALKRRLFERSEKDATEVYSQKYSDVVRAINSLRDIDASLKLIFSECREWFEPHFPELWQAVSRDKEAYLKLVNSLGDKKNFSEEAVSRLLGDNKKAKGIAAKALKSRGRAMDENSLAEIKRLASSALGLLEEKKSLEKFVEGFLETGGTGQDAIKPETGPAEKSLLQPKFVVPAIVAIAILLFALDFFVLSNSEVKISVFDTEGNDLAVHDTAAEITLFQDGITEPLYSKYSSDSMFVLKRGGSYFIQVADSKGVFKPVEHPYTAPNGSQNVQIILQKNLSTRIQKLEFPSNLFAGETASGRIELFNKGKKDEEIELVAETTSSTADMAGITLAIEPRIQTVAAGQTATATIKIGIAQGAQISEAVEKVISFRIKYLKGGAAEETASFTIGPKAQT